MANTLDNYNMATITAVKSFTALDPGEKNSKNLAKLISLKL